MQVSTWCVSQYCPLLQFLVNTLKVEMMGTSVPATGRDVIHDLKSSHSDEISRAYTEGKNWFYASLVGHNHHSYAPYVMRHAHSAMIHVFRHALMLYSCHTLFLKTIWKNKVE